MSKIQFIKLELHYYRLLAADNRTPKAARVLLTLALAYLVLPFDLIPDFIPVLGQIDDVVIVPVLVWLSLLCIPKRLKQEIRQTSKILP